MNELSDVVTLVEMLRERADDNSGNGYRFVRDKNFPLLELSYGELELRVRDVAAELSLVVPQGGRAVLVYPPGLDFIVAFFGALFAGVVPVPVYPPSAGDQDLSRLEHVLRDARPDIVLTVSGMPALDNGTGAGPGRLATDEVPAGAGADWRSPRITADDIAVIQYTSGSTAMPRGVVVRHKQLMANLAAIKASMDVTADSTAVGWVPSYHDMGLVGYILEAVYAGFSSYLLAPQAFLARPALWLETISRFGGVVSGGPNFGFELCTRRVTEPELDGLELSSWRLAFSGAEQIRPEALRRFGERFEPAGFDRNAFYSCYGLAEASLFVTGARHGGSWVDRRGLEIGEARPAGTGAPHAVEVASCGYVADGHHIVVVDSESAEPVSAGTVGEVWFSGPSIADGYWGRPQESDDVFRARLSNGDGPFLRTGDLGFLRDGQLFITGRRKDVMIVHGRNIYPTDVENVTQSVSNLLRPGCGASFQVGGDSTDLVIVQETSERDESRLRDMALDVRRTVLRRLNVTIADVVLARPRTLAKTSSGKLRRHACREAYLRGTLDVVFRLSAPGPALASSRDRI